MRWQLVVFDIAGTTVADPGLVEQAFLDALQAAGRHLPVDEVRGWMGYAKPEAIARLLQLPVDAPEVNAVHAAFVARMRAFVRHDARIRPLPGAEALFARLREHGVRVALGTGFCTAITTDLLHRLQWETRIDAWVASDQVPAARPAAHMIHVLMRRCAVSDPALVVKVGDTPVDMAEGRGADVGLCVAVTTGAHDRATLMAAGADRVIDHLDELPALLGLS